MGLEMMQQDLENVAEWTKRQIEVRDLGETRFTRARASIFVFFGRRIVLLLSDTICFLVWIYKMIG